MKEPVFMIVENKYKIEISYPDSKYTIIAGSRGIVLNAAKEDNNEEFVFDCAFPAVVERNGRQMFKPVRTRVMDNEIKKLGYGLAPQELRDWERDAISIW